MRSIRVTATGLVHTGHICVEGVSLVPASASSTIVLNDSLDGSGTNKGGAKTDATYSTETCLYSEMFNTGIYVTLTGAGAVAYIYYK
jgi:hypothetical protein